MHVLAVSGSAANVKLEDGISHTATTLPRLQAARKAWIE